MRGCPASKCGRTAGLVHEDYQDAQYDEEDQDAHVVAVGQGGHDPVVEDMGQCPLKTEIRVQQAAHQDAYEQGRIHFLRDQRQSDGDDSREQRPKGLIKTRWGFCVPFTLSEGYSGRYKQKDEQDG